MKKAEAHKTPFTRSTATNGSIQPTAPANRVQQIAPLGYADPSSTFRSSRYPVPAFEFRTGAA